MTGRRDSEYADFVSARLPSLRRLTLLLCHDWQRTDDLVQAAIIRLYLKWAKAAAADNTDAYVRTILVGEFLHEHRSGWARLVRLGDELPTEQAAPVLDQEAALDLQAAVAALPPRQRAALVLRFYCDLSVEASAQILGCSPGTVKSQTARALSTLRRQLLGSDDATSRLAASESERGESGPDLDQAAPDGPAHRGVSFNA